MAGVKPEWRRRIERVNRLQMASQAAQAAALGDALRCTGHSSLAEKQESAKERAVRGHNFAR